MKTDVSDKLKKTFLKINEFFSSKKIKYVIVFILCLSVIIIFSSSFKFNNKSNSADTKKISTTEKTSWQSYCESQEHRLEHILTSVKGVTDVKVFVMVDAGPTITYLENKNESSSSNSTTSFQTTAVELKNGTITTPVVVVETLPKIVGVLVVACGASDIKLKNTLANVISSVMKINLSNVEVLEGK